MNDASVNCAIGGGDGGMGVVVAVGAQDPECGGGRAVLFEDVTQSQEIDGAGGDGGGGDIHAGVAAIEISSDGTAGEVDSSAVDEQGAGAGDGAAGLSEIGICAGDGELGGAGCDGAEIREVADDPAEAAGAIVGLDGSV